ncbi:MAG: bacteriocin [Pseudomonadota bacterium]
MTDTRANPKSNDATELDDKELDTVNGGYDVKLGFIELEASIPEARKTGGR